MPRVSPACVPEAEPSGGFEFPITLILLDSQSVSVFTFTFHLDRSFGRGQDGRPARGLSLLARPYICVLSLTPYKLYL